MRILKSSTPPQSRRSLLKIGGAALGLGALGAFGRSAARADTIQAAQLTDSDKVDIARIEGYLNAMSSVKASFQQYTDSEGLKRVGGSRRQIREAVNAET